MTLTSESLYQSKISSSLHNSYLQHHLHPLSSSLFRKNSKWETNSPLIQGKMKNSTTQPTRIEIIDWYHYYISNKFDIQGQDRLPLSYLILDLGGVTFAFYRLSQQDFVASTVIDSYHFIEKFLKNHGIGEDKLIHLPTSRTIPFLNPNSSSHTQLILDWIRYAPIYDQQIYLNPEVTSPKIMLQWLEDITRMRVFELPLRSINKDRPEQNLLWFNNQTFHSLAEWLANQFQKSILRYYFNQKDYHSTIKNMKKYMQQKGADRRVIHFLQIPLIDIKEGFLDKNGNLIAHLRSYEDKMKQDFQIKLINLSEDASKKRKKRKARQKKFSSHQNLDSITTNIQPFDSLNNIQYLDEPNENNQVSINNNSYQTLELEKSNNSAFYSPQDNVISNLKTTQIDINPQVPSPIKSISKKSQKTCCGQCSQEEDDKHHQTNDEFDMLKRQISLAEDVLSEIAEEKKRKRKKRGTKNIKIFEEFKNRALNRLINKQLDKFLDELSASSNANYDSKVLAFERVRYFVKSIFPNCEASLFGSNAVGLSLPTSDIDIMLVGLPLSSRDQLCDYLAQIGVYIHSMGWIVSCSTYLGAKVPLLKLQIDTSIKYFTPKIKLNYQQTYDPYLSYFLDLRDTSAASIIKVDITISLDSSHISPSTQLMRNWLHQRPSLQRILLALKYTLAVRGFSQNFKGGIGSYCLFVMVAAYFQHFNESRQKSDCQILLDILKFYGEQFDNHLKIIHLTDSQQCYFTNEEALQQYELTQQLIFTNSLKILDPLNRKLMSSSCYQYALIKSQWRRIRENILKIGEQVEEEISTCFTNTADMAKLLANNKGFEKWVNRLQGRIEISVGLILKGAI